MDSESFIQAFFKNNYNIRLSKIKESEDKTPDFEFIHDGKKEFVCELKTIERIRTQAAGWEIINESDGIREATRDDNSVGRVAKKIHESYKQLKSYTEPKVLIFLNEDNLVDVGDLEEAYNGYHIYSNEEVKLFNTASKKIANGIIKDEKGVIDLYIWVDKLKNKAFFRCSTQIGYDLICKYFKNIHSLS